MPDAANLEREGRVAIRFVELRARPALRSTLEIEEEHMCAMEAQ